MAVNVSRVPSKEKNTHSQGRSGSGTMTKPGKATGKGDLGNKGKGRAAWGKKAQGNRV